MSTSETLTLKELVEKLELAERTFDHNQWLDAECRRYLLDHGKALSEALGGWLPIETCPEDGEFLVYMPDGSRKIQAARWSPNIKTIGTAFAFDLTKPTHWRPLPPPPTSAKGSGE